MGLNEHHLPWDYYGRPAVECIREHWERLKGEVYERVGIDPSIGKRMRRNDLRHEWGENAAPALGP